jgi:RNA polymerase sigma-70 factor (ECF subfamily)
MSSHADAIERIAQGDRAAFGALYERCASGVYAYLRSRGLDEATAADALQDTFLAAWNGASGFRGDARELTWLIGIARHKLVDSVRRRERARAAPPEQFDGACDPMAGQAERLSLRAAVDTLDDDARELLHLVFAQGMNYAEAAALLGIPEGTVKSRMHHIRRALAAQMTQEAD